jgi:hypothetical protein
MQEEILTEQAEVVGCRQQCHRADGREEAVSGAANPGRRDEAGVAGKRRT